MTAKLEKGKTEMFIHVCMDGCMYVSMYLCMDGWMYVCSFLFTSELLLYHGSISKFGKPLRAGIMRQK